MIFSDLQQTIVDRLLWDAYFTEDDKQVTVLPEVALDLTNAIKKALGDIGVIVVVRTVQVKPTDRVDLANVGVVLEIAEMVAVNRGKNGSGKPAIDVGAKCMALLRGWSPNQDMWAPFLLWGEGLQHAGTNDQGCDLWTLEFMTQTVLETLATVLGTENNIGIGDENGTPLIVSPVAA